MATTTSANAGSLGFRHADPRYPPLWERRAQPAARWHGAGDGPVQYLADTPDGAWAEFLRHEEITDPEDLPTIRRALWAVTLPNLTFATPTLPLDVLQGDQTSYPECQAEATRLRNAGAPGLTAPSAALQRGGAAGWQVERGVKQAPARDGLVVVLFGAQPSLTCWCTAIGYPASGLLAQVRHFNGTQTVSP